MMGASCWGHSNERNCVGLLCDSFCLRAHVLLGSLFFAFHTLVSRSLVGQGTAHKTRKSYMYHHCHGSFLKNLEYRHRHGFSVKKTSVSPSPWTLCQKKASASPSPWVNCQKILPLPWAPVTAQLPGADRPKLAIGQWYLSLRDCFALTGQNVRRQKSLDVWANWQNINSGLTMAMNLAYSTMSRPGSSREPGQLKSGSRSLILALILILHGRELKSILAEWTRKRL